MKRKDKNKYVYMLKDGLEEKFDDEALKKPFK
jgi:hypothetical protein